MKLFDNLTRKELTAIAPFKSLFRNINEYDRLGADKVRNRLETWFEKYPDDANKNDLRERFRSDDDYNHEGAFFELFLHELLSCLGFTMTVHPEISGTDNSPDFLACIDNRQFYLEATVTGKKSGPFTRNKNEQDVVEKLNTLRSPNFRITIHVEGRLMQTLNRDKVVRPFEKLLEDHSPDVVQHLIKERGRNAAPSERIKCGNWSLEGWLNPIAPEKRNDDFKRPIILGNHRAKRTDCSSSVKKALREKARKYRNLNAPFMVAVHARDQFYHDREHDVEVLFGQEQLLYSKDQPDLPPEFDRKKNGIWSRESRIDAFWSFQRVDLWNLWHSASGCLYLNPNNPTVTFPDALFRLPHTIDCDGRIKWIEGESITEILGI